MDCPKCGLTNRPYAEVCKHCAGPLQDAASAEAKKKEWEALPVGLRAEFENDFTKQRGLHVEHLRWLRRYRWVHAVIGGVCYWMASLMPSLVCGAPDWLFWANFILGGAASFLLNVHHGGAWRGFGYFLAAYAVTMVIAMSLGPAVEGPKLAKNFFFVGLFSPPVVAAGYILGMKFDWEHFERAFRA